MRKPISSMAFLPLSLMALAMMAVGCKTTESNYRQAYETAVAKNRDSSGVDSTIYAKIRNSARTSDLVVTGDTMPMRTEYIGYTEDGGASRETIGRYNVVVGQFKQVFNARQMRARLQSSGYDSAFIIHTREPLYYVCTQACATPEEAEKAFIRVKDDKSIVLRDPLPFILRPAHLAR
ncbi:SPOR domain-containing protein [uncultured Duncaniella sp.]|uniref:SPOR domain-containing protein n=1 Tax=uncultured Duncaniella sp. TaxID=2768039 RepID=UPI0025A97E2A|nr:SPOR domain-containing protein [uncultured Duncaniella sp.]